jgi:flavodoxin
MNALIIYDSFFGNTEQIARAIDTALQETATVEVKQVKEVDPEDITNAQLLIVGSPTRAFQPTGAIKQFLRQLAKESLKGVRVAAFDTRIALDDINSRILPPLVKMFGYAAEPIAKKLSKKGGTLVVPPEGFLVKDTEGPLKEGELERAAEWATQIITV